MGTKGVVILVLSLRPAPTLQAGFALFSLNGVSAELGSAFYNYAMLRPSAPARLLYYITMTASNLIALAVMVEMVALPAMDRATAGVVVVVSIGIVFLRTAGMYVVPQRANVSHRKSHHIETRFFDACRLRPLTVVWCSGGMGLISSRQA